ncbi:MAG: hypothetical protein ACLU77_05910 [Waltera sp.]
MEQNTQQDRAKLLEQQAREYLMQSKDPIFTQYVQQLIPENTETAPVCGAVTGGAG